MSQSTECPRCANCVPVPDAATCSDFLRAAHHAWQTAHPRTRKPRGRPLVESEVAATAEALIAAAQRAGKELTHRHLFAQLGNTYPDLDDSTLRRHVRLALIESKRLTELTAEDIKFLKTRRRTLLRMRDEFAPRMTAVLQHIEQHWASLANRIERFASNLPAKIRNDFPDQYAAAEATGQPLTFAELERL